MNIGTYVKMKFYEAVIWFKRKWYGDVRPVAVRPPPKRKPRKNKETKT